MIRVDHLTKFYGPVCAVRDLSLHVPRGELFCFLGPNGAGKTTTIKMMTGLLPPTRGTIAIGGVDLRKDPLAVKRRIGYIPDMPFLYERLTAVEFMRFIGDLYDLPEADVRTGIASLFPLFDLQDSANALIRSLSHGMRQRLIYCATFLHNPEVLFIDEPLIGLDPRSIRLIKTLLRRKAAEGMTVFLSTHILSLAESVADRIAILRNGQVAAIGSLGDLRRQSGLHGSLEEVYLRLTGGEAEESVLPAAGAEGGG